jgi:triacylglycerol lipase
LRKFLEAVIAYTNATKVVVIGHSMGVTLGRKIIKGGQVTDHVEGNYTIGPSLHDKVHAFIGIAGANYGLTDCYGVSPEKYPTCNKVDGFYPGLMASSSPSTYLNQLNV